jgi:hypothetical protein
VYVQVVPLHAEPKLFVESHVRLHPEQLVVVFVCVSQPIRFGAAVVQSPQPAVHT